MSCDQNTPTPFLHCQRPGDGHGFIELVFHTCTVGRGDCDFEVNRVLHQSIFLVSDCLVHSHELLVNGPPNLKRGGVDDVELRTMWVRYRDASRWYFSSREPRLAKLATRTTSISTGGWQQWVSAFQTSCPAVSTTRLSSPSDPYHQVVTTTRQCDEPRIPCFRRSSKPTSGRRT